MSNFLPMFSIYFYKLSQTKSNLVLQVPDNLKKIKMFLVTKYGKLRPIIQICLIAKKKSMAMFELDQGSNP